MTGGQAVAREVNLRIALALADVVVRTLKQFDGGAGAEITAADANHHKHVRVAADFLSGKLNALDFLGRLGHRQVQPAQKIIAGAGALRQGFVRLKDLLFHRQKIRQGDLAPHIGNINFDHSMITRPFIDIGLTVLILQ